LAARLQAAKGLERSRRGFTENLETAVMKTKRGRHPKSLANLKPFRKGVSPNAGGRPKGFAARIRERCGEDYGLIADALYVIGYGTAAQRRAFFGERVTVSTRDRLVAIIELRDSGPGRPAQAIDLDGWPQVPMFAISCLPDLSPNPSLPHQLPIRDLPPADGT
jgi:hypothetical protein